MANRSTEDPREIGGTYWCGYWQRSYVVLDMGGGPHTPWWRVQWDDGHVTTHSTRWETRLGDRVVSLPDGAAPTEPEEVDPGPFCPKCWRHTDCVCTEEGARAYLERMLRLD